MSITAVHPQYEKFLPIWLKLNDVFAGQDVIKGQRLKYLPALMSMVLDGMKNAEDLGFQRYDQYLLRANFPDDYSEAVRNNHGLLWSKQATIQLPEEMHYMFTSATRDGMGIQALLATVNEMQLRNGRVGLLLDLDSVASVDNKPFISVYYAPSIRNWDTAERRQDGAIARDALNMLVLDESGPVRDADSFDWHDQIRRRVLLLGKLETDDPQEAGIVYSQGLFVDSEEVAFDKQQMMVPKYKGTPLNEIPFVAINASDCLVEPDTPPLLGLANLVLSMYISDADYRQHLSTQGQDTLVRIGASGSGTDDGTAPVRVGANSVMDVAMGGDVKYVGIESKGLEEARLALSNDKAEAQLKAGQMVNNTKGSQESGEALRTRIGARTASLVQLAKTGASGVEDLLKLCARWMGLDESEVIVKPNLDFSKALFSGQNLVQTMSARQLGAPVCLETIHTYLADQGLTTLTFEDEMEKMKDEVDKYPFILEMMAAGKADQNGVQQAQGGKVGAGGTPQGNQKPDA